ncbi:MAG: hypothetical protein HQK93_06465 [Nitrospirae bacterium]|nr:hypothetical protein [Nitrospirota bacterium]
MAYSNNVVEKLVNSTDNASEVFNQASNAIENTSNKIDVLKERSQEAESVTNQLTEAWKNLKHILDEYLVLDIAKEMVKTASATENLKLSLSTVTESQKATNEIFEQYEQIIINTPEKIEGLVNAHVKLSNSVKDITPNEIRDLGLAALAAGKGSEGIMQLANALANLYNAAKASEQSIMSLKNAGLNTVEIFKNVETFALTGKEAFNMVMAYVVSHSAENAEKIKNNWSTLTTEMSNMWEVFQNELMKAGLFDILKDGLKSVISEFKELSDDGTLKAWITDITGAIKLLVENWHILIGAVVLLKKEMIESAIVSLVSAKTSMAELGTETVMVEKNLVGLRSGITTVEVVTKEFSLATLATNAWGKAIESVGLKFGLLAFDIGYAIPKIIEAISILNDWRKTVKETAEHDAAWHKKHDVSVPKEGEDKILVKQTDDEINEKTKQQQEAVKKLSDLKKEMYQNEIREAEKVLHNYEKLKEAGVKAYQAIIDKQIESNKWSEDFNKSLDKLERQVNNEGLSKESVESNNQQYVKSLLSKTQEAVGNIKSQADIDNVKELEKETRSEISTISDKRIKLQIIAALREVEIKRQEEQIKLTEKQAEAQKKKNEELDKNINHIKINISDIQAKLKDLAEKPIEIRIKLQEVALKKINDELDALQKKKDQIEGKTSQEEPKSPEKKDIVKSQDDKSMEQEKSRIEEMIPVPLDDALKYGSFSKERRIDMRNQLIAQGYNVGNMGLDDNTPLSQLIF